MSGDQIKKKARGLGSLFRNPWFGRRDLLPPASDERTALIDRGMVGLGLLTPEQLVEIHEVGAQMEKLKPDLAQAAGIADEAVKLDEEERKQRKEQKKAESAERKRLHAEGVVHRKQTDIVFLGRGVSGGLADRRANVEKLQRLQLPALATPADLAKALNLPIPRLRWRDARALRTAPGPCGHAAMDPAAHPGKDSDPRCCARICSRARHDEQCRPSRGARSGGESGS